MVTLNDVKPGMIGLSGGKTFIQKAIEFFTRSQYSHTFVIIDGPEKVLSTIETTSTIIQVVPTERKLKEPDFIEIYEPIIDERAKRRALRLAYKEYAGVSYGYLSYLWFMYRAVARLFGKEPAHMWHWASKGIICSEFGCYYISMLGGDFAALFTDRDFNTYSPQEVKGLFEQNPKLFRFVGQLKPQTEE